MSLIRPFKALDHTVRLWMARLYQTMSDLEQRALAVKRMLARRLFGLAGRATSGGEPISELATWEGWMVACALMQAFA